MTLTNDFIDQAKADLRKVQVALWDQGFTAEASAVRDVRNALRALRVDPNAPRTVEQHKALFASFGRAFPMASDADRHAFTRAVLGKRDDEAVSWAFHNPACLTVAQADRLQTVLDLCTGL